MGLYAADNNIARMYCRDADIFHQYRVQKEQFRWVTGKFFYQFVKFELHSVADHADCMATMILQPEYILIASCETIELKSRLYDAFSVTRTLFRYQDIFLHNRHCIGVR